MSGRKTVKVSRKAKAKTVSHSYIYMYIYCVFRQKKYDMINYDW